MLANPAWHTVFETLGYTAGYALYRWTRAERGDFLSPEQRWATMAAAAIGALAGSRILAILEQAPLRGFHWSEVFAAAGGKTIVGGLLGGWLAVELAKLALGIRGRTGDLYAVPICIGVAIGRIGCFLAGLADDTYGTPTTLPWGVDFGDGVRRHPTQLYEMIFLLGLAFVLWRWNARPHKQGQVFRVFMAGYLSWRLMVDFLKPEPLWMGLGVIQWACLAGIAAVAVGARPNA
jgi:prolipoprotein diacylglyceryltransferase